MNDNATHRDPSTLRFLVGIAGLACALGAQAGEPASAYQEVRSVVVDYSDLDLSETKDVQVMYARLTAAAREACGNGPATRELRRAAEYRACRDRALNDAVVGVDDTRLQALHAERSQRSRAS